VRGGGPYSGILGLTQTSRRARGELGLNRSSSSPTRRYLRISNLKNGFLLGGHLRAGEESSLQQIGRGELSKKCQRWQAHDGARVKLKV